MELEIVKKAKIERRTTPHYILKIDFMEGDADDYHHEEIVIEPKDLEKYKGLIHAVECCNAAYQNGRGGYDEYNGLLEYDAFFGDEVDIENYEPADFDLDGDVSDEEFQAALDKKIAEINPLGIWVNHPCNSDYGIHDSFDGYELLYYDENGDSFPVKVTLSDEEKERVNYAMTRFT
jgi:hypothetical protein